MALATVVFVVIFIFLSNRFYHPVSRSAQDTWTTPYIPPGKRGSTRAEVIESTQYIEEKGKQVDDVEK
jgi:hypothetical protein